MGHSDGSPTAMKNFLSAKAAGLFRRFSARLREDYDLADYAPLSYLAHSSESARLNSQCAFDHAWRERN
jgi:hypothetical protein